MKKLCSKCGNSLMPLELKATYQSSDRPIEENTHWLRQLLSQCYVLGAPQAIMSRLSLMGNWKSIFGKKEDKQLPENRKPALSVYRLTFSREELDANWKWLQGRREQFLKILETKQLLPKIQALPSADDFECDRCPYIGDCK